jgi:2-polyprenyl-6-methoxyphenol hydroxylase-like FAD-dependent oxidoreductase
VVTLLENYDATGRPAAILAEYVSVAWRKRLRIFNTPSPRHMSNWGCLYQILRANFDGLRSDAVPEPPQAKPTDGKVEYRSGKRVTDLSYNEDKGTVTVLFADVTTGEQDKLTADLVLGADGIHSTVRSLLLAPTRKEYGGYIGWRGTVPENLLSPKTVEYFSNRLNFSLMQGTYFIRYVDVLMQVQLQSRCTTQHSLTHKSYIIPTESGQVEPGQRLLNWVWYYKVADGSTELEAIFTDKNGKIRPNTVPVGLVDPDLWASQKARYVDKMTGPLAEIVSRTPQPFVTKVREAECEASSFYDGHVVLVGDAFAAFRSHMGLASEQAARHCIQMGMLWKGEISQRERDQMATDYAKKYLLLNKIIGLGGLGMVLQVLKLASAYMWLLIGQSVRQAQH